MEKLRKARTHALLFKSCQTVVAFGCLAAALSSPLSAVIFYNTADPDFNTTAPTGTLTDSGWQWVGSWIGFQGAAIGPHHFLAARHIGGSVGDVFVLNGVTYTTIASFDDTASDLRIWQISGTFPSWAPLYRVSTEVSRTLMVFGRGLTRGAGVYETAHNSLRGWQWGDGDGRLRWGQNVVKSSSNQGSYWGELLYATFDASSNANQAHLAVGDSSGPVFIDDGTGWKLAGVAAAVDAYFNTTSTGSGFNAAIFDSRELYYNGNPSGNPNGWQLVTGSQPVPSGFYATRVSVRAAWIDSVIPPDQNGADTPLLSPAGSAIFVALIFATGCFYLSRRKMSERLTG